MCLWVQDTKGFASGGRPAADDGKSTQTVTGVAVDSSPVSPAPADVPTSAAPADGSNEADEPDDEEDFAANRKAALRGDLRAMLYVSGNYSAGEGVAKDYVMAYRWLAACAGRGSEDCAEARDKLQPIIDNEKLGAKLAAAMAGGVKVPKEAAGWKGISVRRSGKPDQLANVVTRHMRRKKLPALDAKVTEPPPDGEEPPPQFVYRWQGSELPATAFARSYREGPERVLVIALHAPALRRHGIHLEVRFTVSGSLLTAAAVQAVKAAADHRATDDSYALRRRGVNFDEFGPGNLRIEAAALEAAPGPLSFNAGKIALAPFGHKDLGMTSLSWSVAGVQVGR